MQPTHSTLASQVARVAAAIFVLLLSDGQRAEAVPQASPVSMAAKAPAAKPTPAKPVPVKPATKKASPKTSPMVLEKSVSKSGSNGSLRIVVSTVELLKNDVVLSVPVETKAKKIVDSPATVLTFPDGAQMTVSPDASSFGDYKKKTVNMEKLLGTPAGEKTIFVVDKADRLIFSNNSGPDLTKRTVFVMQKKLPALVKNEMLAIGMLCSNTGLQEETLAPNRASIDQMMTACDSLSSAK